MPNVDDAAEVDPRAGETGGLYASAAARSVQRRKQAAVGAVGLLAMLGAGIFVVDQVRGGHDQTAVDTGALAPFEADPVTTPSPTPIASRAPSTGASARPGKMPRLQPAAASARYSRSAPASPTTATGQPSAAAEETVPATGAGPPVHRPLSPPSRATVAAAGIKVVETGSLKEEGRTMRIVSARQDLTGQRELSWVADDREAVGDAWCTQTVRLSSDVEPAKHPTLLVCWRTSAEKSVYTVAVDLSGHPSKKDSVAIIDRVWSELT